MSLKKIMKGVYLTGHGGFDKLEYREDIPVPELEKATEPAVGVSLIEHLKTTSLLELLFVLFIAYNHCEDLVTKKYL